MPCTNNEKYTDYRRIYNCFEDEYTFDAKGINVDHMIALSYSEDKKSIFIHEITIDKLFEDIFSQLKEFYKNFDFNDDPLRFINFITDKDIFNISELLSTNNRERYFNYCVKLSDRNQPEIEVSIPNMLNNSKIIIEQLVKDRNNNKVYNKFIRATQSPIPEDFDNEQSYLNRKINYENSLLSSSNELRKTIIKNINEDLCVYIALWIHAYRFKVTLTTVSSDKSNILFSHRFKGWSQPEYELTKDLKLEFATNFGYGKSSYFRLIVVYKDVALINFIEWIDYRIKGASAVKAHTRKYEGYTSSAGVSNRYINNDNWIDATGGTKLICETYLKDEEDFINKFIYESLDSMVKELEDIFEVGILDKDFNAGHRVFEETLESLNIKKTEFSRNTSSIVVMSVKGEKITGALDFISNIMQLKKFFSVDTHILRIKILNKNLLPLMENELNTIPQAKEDCYNLLDSLNKELDALPKFDFENGNELSHKMYIVLEEHERLSALLFETNNNIGILRKCERDIKGYKKVIERFEMQG